MSVHIWCPRASDSAIKLRDALRAAGIAAYKSRLNPTPKQSERFHSRIKPADLWVGWGSTGPLVTLPCKALNHQTQTTDKREQLIKLAQHGIACPEVFDSPAADRLGRSLRHHGGLDLLTATGRDYYTQRLAFVSECRIHIFEGKSIHAGMKVPRPDSETHHPWIRSYASGWGIDYSLAYQIPRQCRTIAKKAVAALSLDFGAVDLGITADGKVAVIEVNTAPGLDPGVSVNAYVRHILRVHNEGG